MSKYCYKSLVEIFANAVLTHTFCKNLDLTHKTRCTVLLLRICISIGPIPLNFLVILESIKHVMNQFCCWCVTSTIKIYAPFEIISVK